MKCKLFIGLVITVIIFVGIAGCSSSSSSSGSTPTATPSAGPAATITPTPTPTISPSDPLLGTWTAPFGTRTLKFTFYANGSALYDNGTVDYLPPNSWSRIDDTHYAIVGNYVSSNVTMDATHTTIRYSVLPELTWTKK